MSYPPFNNRLEEYKFNRFKNRIIIHAGIIALFLFCFAFVDISHAQATDYWNPGNAPTYNPVTDGGCDGSACSTTSYVMFRAGLWDGSNYDTPYTCAVAMTTGHTSISIEHQTGHQSGSNWATFNSELANSSRRCWSGGVWNGAGSSFQVGSNFPMNNGAAGIILSSDAAGVGIADLIHGTINVYQSGTFNYGANYNSAGSITDLTIVYYAPAQPSVTFSANVYSAVAGSTIHFTAAWNALAFDPYYAYFYEDINDGDSNAIQYLGGIPLSSGGLLEVFHNYNIASGLNQPYHPYIRLGNTHCDTLTSSGCVLISAYTSTGLTITDVVTSSDDNLYPSTMTGAKLDNVRVGDTDLFTYNINPPCTTTGKRFFLGYAPALQKYDTGAVLPVSTHGTYNAIFPRTDQPYSDFFFPYINSYCSDGTSRQLYLGNTWNQAKARGVSVYTQSELNGISQRLIPMLNGGSSANFSNSSGASLTSDKRIYAKLEPVLLELNYHVSFTPTSVLVFPTGTGAAGFSFGSGSSFLQQGVYLRSTITYNTSGFYQPVIKVTSSNPSIYRYIFLGGDNVPVPYNQISITSDIFGSIAQLFSTKDGIFGLDPSTFSISFGASNNQFLQDASAGVSKIISAGLYVANIGYNLLKSSPVYSFFFDIIHPPNNSTYYFPTKLFGYTLPYRPYDTSFTVTYADANSGSKYLEYIVRALAASFIIKFFLKSFA